MTFITAIGSRVLTGIVLAVCLSGCASTGRLNPKELKDLPSTYSQICQFGADVRSVKGSVWMRASSPEASGQFPATVVANAPDRLALEVTNLLGGIEATIKVEGSRFQIELPQSGGTKRSKKGANHWGGIPLRWATTLFLGRIPCPDPKLPPTLEASAESDLIVRAGAETYRYRLTHWAGRLRTEALRWDGESGVAVDFKFEDPEPNSGFSRRWEAKSKQGEVKVRWKDREALR